MIGSSEGGDRPIPRRRRRLSAAATIVVLPAAILLGGVGGGTAWGRETPGAGDPPPGENLTPLIYNGEDASNPGFIIALFRDGYYYCTGSLIHPRFVLTAAHCVDSPGSYSVMAGEEYLYASGIRRSVTRVSIHPGWGGSFNDPDLAVLELSSPITTLPVATLNTNPLWPELTQVLAVAGWGRYYEGSPPADFLQFGIFYASSGMDGSYDPYYCDLPSGARVPGGVFCFGGPVSVSACPGDSGGPVMGLPTPSATDGDLVIYGVVSYGEQYCGPQFSDAVAQSVGGQAAWITSIIGAGTAPTGHTTGLVDPATGIWYLYGGDGRLRTSFYYGNPGDYPFMGDWDGDGIETPGLYRRSDGYVYLRNSNTQGVADVSFYFGNPGDVPIAGDFNGDGKDTVSIYRPSEQRFYIINRLGSGDAGLGVADFSYIFGNPGDKPFVGDFDGDGIETAGLHRESTGLVYFRNTHTQGVADAQFIFGDPGDRLIAGDWTDDGVFTPGLFRPSNTTMYFRYTNTQGVADFSFWAGQSGFLPVSGRTG